MERAGVVAVIALCFGAIAALILFLAHYTEKINTRANACNVACEDKRTNIEDNKCYCLNGKDWVYRRDMEDK